MSISFKDMNVGKKIASSFGAVGVLFLFVVWQYQTTLNHTLSVYQDEVLGQAEDMKGTANNINSLMLQARRSEKDFLMRLDKKYVGRVQKLVEKIQVKAEHIVQIGVGSLLIIYRGGATLYSSPGLPLTRCLAL